MHRPTENAGSRIEAIKASLRNRVGSNLVMKILAKFAKCESGATAIEYGLIAALISVASIAAISNVSSEIQGTFNDAKDAMANR